MADLVDVLAVRLENQISAAADAATASLNKMGDAGDRVDATVTRAGRSATSYVRALDPVTRTHQALNKALTDQVKLQEALADGLAKGTINQQQANRAADAQATKIQSIRQALAELHDGAGQAATSNTRLQFAMRDLGLQSIDLFQGIATGQPVFRTFIQQGAQVAQVNAAMGVSMRDFGGAIAGVLLSPLALAIAGIGALGVAAYTVTSRVGELEAEQRALATSINAVGKAAETSAGQLSGYVEQLKAQSGLSRSDATSIVSSLARNPSLSSQQIGQVVGLTPDFATAIGTDEAAAAKQLADVVSGSADAIKKLDDQLNILTPDQRAAAQVALDHGDKARALGIVMDELTGRIKGLHDDALSPTDQAFQNMAGSWDNFISTVAASRPVLAAMDLWANTINGLARTIGGASLSDNIEKLGTLREQLATAQADLARVPVSQPLNRAYAQHQVDAFQQQIDSLLKAADAQSLKLGQRLPSDVVYGADEPSPSALAVRSKSIFDTAQSRVQGSTAGQIDKYKTEIAQFQSELDKLGGRTSDNAARFDTLTAAIAADGKAIDDLNKKNQGHIATADKQAATLEQQIAAQRGLITAYADGGAAVQQYQAREAAAKQLISDGVLPTAKNYNAELDKRTALFTTLNQLTAQAEVAKQTAANQDQIDYLAAESASLGMNNDARTEMLAHLKAEQDLKRRGVDLESNVARAYLESTDAITAGTLALQRQEQALNELGNMATQIADQIGNALTQAFVSGQGGAVNFGNVARAVMASVLQEVAKLAVINPVLNSITGGTRTTLTDALGAVGGGGGAAGSGGSLFSLNNLSTLYSVGKTAAGFYGGSTGTLSPFVDSLATSYAPGLFNAFPASAYAALPQGVAGPVVNASEMGLIPYTASSAIGGFAGGIGGGYAIGSLAGGAIQGSLNKVGPAPQIGAGVGAVGGAIAGFAIGGPVGALIGGLLGGSLGGGGGGLIGPQAPSPYSSTGLGLSGGGLSVGDTLSQATDASSLVATLKQQVSDTNTFLQQIGVKIDGQSSYSQFGQNTPGGYVDPSKFSDLFTPNTTGQSAFSKYAFSAPGNDRLNVFLQGKSFATLSDMEGFIRDFQAGQDALNQLLQVTAPQLEAVGKTTGSYNDTIKALNDQYGAAINQAEALKSAVGIAADQVDSLTKAETDLADARDRATQAALEAVMKQGRQTDENLTIRYLNAAASVSGSPADALNAQLTSFDVNAGREREAFTDQLVATWGDSIKSTTAYADQIALLEKTLGEERLAIQQQYNDRITQSAASTITSLADYAAKLSVGSSSPLSPIARYEAASRQFLAVSGSAAAGNYNSVAQLQGYSDSFLAASQIVNGSGIGYANDVNLVLDALNRVGQTSSDALTASIYAAETRTQTQVLQGSLDALRGEVAALRADMTQAANKPSRAA